MFDLDVLEEGGLRAVALAATGSGAVIVPGDLVGCPPVPFLLFLLV